MTKKVGLVLAFKGTNYGALLQAYATQYIIESLGFETEIIDYQSTSKLDNLYFSFGFIKYYVQSRKNRSIISKKTGVQEQNEVFLRNRDERRQISNEFRHRRLHSIRKVTGLKELRKIVREYCAVIVGSDQKWIPGACYGWIDSLRFVPDGIRRISYATSLGVSEYPKYCWADSKKMWKKIDFLSVREQQGASIIKQICGNIDVNIVLDPTYLISKQQWVNLIPPRNMSENRYAFCFFLGNDIESKECAKRYANSRGLRVISLFSNESFSNIDLSYADEVVSGVTPEDFINWIRGAEIVLTDSFHGLAFSVINEKQLYVFYRKRDDALLSRNSRIDNILNTWEIEDRLIIDKNVDWNTIKDTPIDYAKVGAILKERRNESLGFLKKALSFE